MVYNLRRGWIRLASTHASVLRNTLTHYLNYFFVTTLYWGSQPWLKKKKKEKKKKKVRHRGKKLKQKKDKLLNVLMCTWHIKQHFYCFTPSTIWIYHSTIFDVLWATQDRERYERGILETLIRSWAGVGRGSSLWTTCSGTSHSACVYDCILFLFSFYKASQFLENEACALLWQHGNEEYFLEIARCPQYVLVLVQYQTWVLTLN